MRKKTYQFSSRKVDYYFDASFAYLDGLISKDHAVLITDDHVFDAHKKKFKGWNTIVLKPGEEYKVQDTVNSIIHQLIEFKADRSTFIVGIGGGVITDLTGYVASIYMRGLPFGFIPTTILAMVDASIGGKNGIDVGVYKNLAGTINQPSFLLYDLDLLKSLPASEWINGFAEIIKHSCIKDARLFRELEKNNLAHYRKDRAALAALIRKNVVIKSDVVQKDEFEQGDRRLLNFGHTLGHAIEKIYELSHGQAISIGMTAACRISEQITTFDDTERVMEVLTRYGLPTLAEYDKKMAWEILQMDKKKDKAAMRYVLLNKIGEGTVKLIPIQELEQLIYSL